MTALFPEHPRAARNGWSRDWEAGQPHVFLEGCYAALCGAISSPSHGLSLTREPDGDLPERERKTACPRCLRKYQQRDRGHSR